MKAKITTTILLVVLAVFVIFPPTSGNPFVPSKDYEEFTAIAVANENLPATQVLVLNALRAATSKRNMTFRNYDEQQPAAVNLLQAIEQEPPALIIYDQSSSEVVDVYPLPETVEDLEDVLGIVPE